MREAWRGADVLADVLGGELGAGRLAGVHVPGLARRSGRTGRSGRPAPGRPELGTGKSEPGLERNPLATPSRLWALASAFLSRLAVLTRAVGTRCPRGMSAPVTSVGQTHPVRA